MSINGKDYGICFHIKKVYKCNICSFKERGESMWRSRTDLCIRQEREYNEYSTMKSLHFIFSSSPLKKTIKCFKKKNERKIFLRWAAFKIPLLKVKDCGCHQLVRSLIYLNLSRPHYSVSHYVSPNSLSFAKIWNLCHRNHFHGI